MPETRIVFLRAINVGGTAKLPMADLREIATQLGATNVRSYIQSGNLICDVSGSADAFDRALEVAIENGFGFFHEAISRSPAEIRAALDAHPFDVFEPKFSYITFLAEPPTDEAIARAQEIETGDDVWTVTGDDMHIRYAEGAGRAQMSAAKIGKVLGVPGTARNLNTVGKLLAMSE